MSLTEKAKDFATKAHAGQKRWGGEPYITHPEAVAALVKDGHKPVAWLHDVMEDCGVTCLDLRQAGFPLQVISSVSLLTRTPPYKYLPYILSILESGDKAAIEVKKADIRHNLSAMAQGQVRDRYEMALWILEIGDA